VTDYVVIYERAEDGGWGAYLPDLPGCVAVGETREEAERLIREGIVIHLDELRRAGRAVPPPSNVAGVVSVRVAPG
jgi:predicted RNase H-like HicB family nuclease